jgi:hypothetical protein
MRESSAAQTLLSHHDRRFLRQALGSAGAQAPCWGAGRRLPLRPLWLCVLLLLASLKLADLYVGVCLRCSVQNLRLLSKAEKAGLLSLGAFPPFPVYGSAQLTR